MSRYSAARLVDEIVKRAIAVTGAKDTGLGTMQIYNAQYERPQECLSLKFIWRSCALAPFNEVRGSWLEREIAAAMAWDDSGIGQSRLQRRVDRAHGVDISAEEHG
jgi:hypothetical protein